MKKATVLLIGLIIITGCKRGRYADRYTDKEAIVELIRSSSIFNQRAPAGNDSARLLLKGSVNPLFWGREIKNIPSPDIEIYIIGDSAYVDYTGYDEGILHLWAWVPDSQKVKHYKRDFSDIFYIKGTFKRLGDVNDPHRGWKLWSVTGIRALSRNVSPDFSIDSMEVRLGNKAFKVKDPLTFRKISEIDTVTKYDTVGIKVYVNKDVNYPYLHVLGPNNKHYRLFMKEILPGVYEKSVCDSSDVKGFHFIVVDILGDETLGEEEGVYKTELWFYLYYKK
ncbi:MAG: hypothetical protein ABDH49_06315 [Candidatus Hydrothermales bacterium]